jgi:hypothetical protein
MLALAWSKFFLIDEMEGRRSVESRELHRLKALLTEARWGEVVEVVGSLVSMVSDCGLASLQGWVGD